MALGVHQSLQVLHRTIGLEHLEGDAIARQDLFVLVGGMQKRAVLGTSADRDGSWRSRICQPDDQSDHDDEKQGEGCRRQRKIAPGHMRVVVRKTRGMRAMWFQETPWEKPHTFRSDIKP